MTEPVLGITMGDPGGIGPEVALKALQDQGTTPFVPFLIGSQAIFQRAAQGLSFRLKLKALKEVEECPEGSIGVIDCVEPELGVLPVGTVSALSGRAAMETLLCGIDLARRGKIDVLVTGPISKRAAHLAGYNFPGQTELLAHYTGTPSFAMMLVNKRLRVALVTTHLPLSQVSRNLFVEVIQDKLRVIDQGLKDYFAVPSPSIGVAALNPHGGEEGDLGEEEKRLISPAIEGAWREGIDAQGPFPSDTLFIPSFLSRFDAILAMYHDQGLIPVKLLGFGCSVNITLGLPIIRTSPDHGVALDIAGQGRADPSSMIEAIRLAWQMRRVKSGYPHP